MSAILDRMKEHNAFFRFFRQSACHRAGLPVEPDAPPEVKLTIDNRSDPPPPAAMPPATPAAARPWGWIAGTAAAVLGSSLIGPLAWNLVQPREPAAPPAIGREIERVEGERSLLQYLEDHGYHRAEGQ